MIPPARACGRLPIPRRLITRRSHIPNRAKTTTTTSSAGPSPSPTASDSHPEIAKTIPGPSWLWLEPIATPFRAYGRAQQRRPYVTQLLSSLVIYFFGDLSAQNISVANADGTYPEKHYDPWRTARALVIGGISSIPSYRWFIWLGNSFNHASKTVSITTKVVVNQIVFTPIFNSYFFGMQSLLTGATGPEVVERIRHTVPVSWVNSCKIWPAVTAFSFAFVPEHFRSIFAGVIAVGWQTYLSVLNQRAAMLEQAAAQEQAVHDQAHNVPSPISSGDKRTRGAEA